MPKGAGLDGCPTPIPPSNNGVQIIDRAWALIVERHPELDTSPADEARAAADIDLKRSCLPSVRLQSPHPPLLLGSACDFRAADAAPVGSGGGTEEAGTEGAESNEEHGNDGGGVGDGRAITTEGFEGISLLRWDRRGEVHRLQNVGESLGGS